MGGCFYDTPPFKIKDYMKWIDENLNYIKTPFSPLQTLQLGSNSANRELHLAAFVMAALNQYLLMGNVDHLWCGVSRSSESLQNAATSAYYKITRLLSP